MKRLKLFFATFTFGFLAACSEKPTSPSQNLPVLSPEPAKPAQQAEPTVGSDGFSGQWDLVLAQPVIERQLDRIVWLGKNVGCEGVCEIKHVVVKEFELTQDSLVEKLVLISSNDATNTCHACAPAISLFRFRKTASGWLLSSSDMAFASFGANGKVSGDRPVEASVTTLSDSQLALLIDLTDAHQGFQETYQFVFVSVDGKFIQAFKERSGQDFSGVNSEIKNAGTIWESKAEIVVQNERKTLILSGIGKRSGKAFKSTKRYIFDGKKFIPA
jgi:hypothetical protein